MNNKDKKNRKFPFSLFLRKKKKSTPVVKRNRLRMVTIGLIIVFTFLVIRLSYIMIVKKHELSLTASEQWTNELQIPAKRGSILDRNGLGLAVSADVYRVDLDLKAIYSDLRLLPQTDSEAVEEHSISVINSVLEFLGIKKSISTKKSEGDVSSLVEMATKISDAAKLDRDDVLNKLKSTNSDGVPISSVILARKIEKEQANSLKELKIRGIIISPDTKRYYVNNNILSHVLGVTDTDSKGLAGIELQYNKELSGIPGISISEVDREKDLLPYKDSDLTAPINGQDITLTIDEQLQNIADNAALSALTENKAKDVSVIIMDPKTGEVLALSNKPDFNSNEPYKGIENFNGNDINQKLQQMWRNPVINNAFEPGSIFKVATSMAAYEEGLIDVGESYYCPGQKYFPDVNTTVNCWKPGGHGTQTFEQTLQNSCNVAFMDIGAKLGKEKFNEYLDKFGFGKLTGVDLPGEATGILKPLKTMSDIDLGTIAFGQTNAITPIQYMAFFNAVANGGTLIQPHLMKEISHTDSDNKVVVDSKFKAKTQEIFSKENAAKLRTHLEAVVTPPSGSAKASYIEGAHIGGKTGTAEKIINGAYSKEKYIATFAAMAPSDDPKVTVLIIIDEPTAGEHFGGLVAAPVGKPIFEQILNYMNLK